jgi:hypothetical protein
MFQFPSCHRPLAATVIGITATLWSASLLALTLPKCDAFEQWSSHFVPGDTFSLAPQLQITTLLRDELTVPLFGTAVTQWTDQDINGLRRGLQQCRREAGKRRDKAAADQLYQTLKAVDLARRALRDMQSARLGVQRTVERLVGYRASPRLARQIALSEDALQGKEPDLQAHGLRSMPDWIPNLRRAPDYLPSAEIDGYIQTLAEHRAALEAGFKAQAEAFEALQQELAGVPLSPAGLRTLQRLEQSPVLREATPQQIDAFRNDITRKRNQIHAAQRQQQAQRTTASGGSAAPGGSPAQANPPADIGTRLSQLLVGDDVDELAIRDLRPGIAKRQAEQHVQRRWGYSPTLSLGLSQAYGKAASMVQFKPMDDAVGQIDFTQRFKVMLNSQGVLDVLQGRFGKPDEVQTIPGGHMATWRDGDQVLQMVATNRVHNVVRYKGYLSRLALALWSEDYEDFLEQQNRRCDEIREIPANQLSIAHKTYMAKHCGYGMGGHKKPGLEAVL